MIEVTLKEYSDNFYLKVIGHSGTKGNSIVCAGVSVLAETFRLTEKALEDLNIPYREGVLEGTIPKTEVSLILVTHLMIGLKSLKQQYPTELTLEIGGF
ncbi:MAG: ribosomal-processing cysteine protease Prp [Brevinema sp.]